MENLQKTKEEISIQPVTLPTIWQTIAILFHRNKDPIVQWHEREIENTTEKQSKDNNIENDQLTWSAEFYQLISKIKQQYVDVDINKLGRNTPIKEFDKYIHSLQTKGKL